jgi:uncharacterized protein with PIN domain
VTRPSFYLDDDSSDRRLVRMLRDRGFDVVAALGDAMSGADDEAHLVHATANGRVLVTANQADFMRLHARWSREGGSTPVWRSSGSSATRSRNRRGGWPRLA